MAQKHALIRKINQFIGLLFIASFFGTFLSLLIPRFSIGQHNFNTPAVLITIAFTCVFIMVVLKAMFRSELPGNLVKLNFFTSFILFVFFPALVGAMIYITIYIPSSRNLLAESDFNGKPLSISLAKESKLYFEFNSGYWDSEGDKINISITGPNNFNFSKDYTIAKRREADRYRSVSSENGNNSFFIDLLPYAGQYSIIIDQLSGDAPIYHVWVYGK